jgi:predicted ATPase
MIERLYIHNFRCFENFTFEPKGLSTVLLLGANGVGKSTVRLVLTMLQRIGRGTNRARDLVAVTDFAQGRTGEPMRIEIEATIAGRSYHYSLAWEFPPGFKELRIFEERLTAEGSPIYSRSQAQVTVHAAPARGEARFRVDWHLVALPVIQVQGDPDDLAIFKRWLAQMIILTPLPVLMTGDSVDAVLEPEPDGSNFGEWFSGLLGSYPAAYSRIDGYLRDAPMTDFGDIRQILVGSKSKQMLVSFQKNGTTLQVPFDNLSDGEKCLLLGALVLAANHVSGPLFCFWDEPDNYLSLSEVGRFVMELRRAFGPGAQLIATSHNPEAIRRFADENTFLLYRNSHLEPTQVRLVSDLGIQGDLVEALIRGDVAPP